MTTPLKVAGGGVVGSVLALAAVVMLEPSCPPQAACLCWDPPVTFEDSSPIPPTLILSYRIYRDAIEAAQPIQQAGPARMCHNLLNEPIGAHTYQVTASNMFAESNKSNAASKIIRAPAPTDGAIEAPTDGSIEDL